MNKILLVEDDLSLIEGLEFSLHKNGFQVEVARTVQETLSLLLGNNMICCCLILHCRMAVGLKYVKKQG